MRKQKLKGKLLAAALSIAIAPLAQADTIAHLDSRSQTGAAGDTLAFFVTLTNTSSTDQVWFNGIGSTASSPGLTIDTSSFDTNAPLFLDPLLSSGLFELFDVTIAPGAPDGPYIGSIVSILGGPDGGAGSAFQDLVDISFDVHVQSSTAITPEPATIGSVLSGLLLLFVIFRRQTLAKR